MSISLPLDVRSRSLELHWMSPAQISEAVGVALEQVEAVVSEPIAESRRGCGRHERTVRDSR
ncbi:hypothetical protein [Lacipirellula parvula]|uniref:Uncharacterized protein n=1 Tax=Lacipirellula parvula TaxID=2650471 RepID=A0A5K7X8Y1_9BACT|nr:hypothetical protein [Lacipirellula parvula]BBO33244.1 hypothetical protein PLANPX_2856 [Lacipirellula parvula]